MSRRRQVVLGGLATAVVAVAGLYAVAWLRVSPVEPAAFFAPRDGENQPLVVAHQGGEGLAPSNTLVAFRQAADVGADVLDADMHMTADGELVLIHDETVDRTTDGTGAVRNLTLADLRTLDFGYHFTTDGGLTWPYRGQGVTVVTVEELFAEFGAGDDNVRFGIEIKQSAEEAATKLCDLIRRFRYEDRVLVSSFGQPNMDTFRQACPEVATSATESEVRTFYVLHRLGLHGLIEPDYRSFQVPEYSGDILVLSPGFVDDATARGLPIVPWTINDHEELERMVDLGVAGINTDYPDRLIELVTVE